MVEAYVVVNSEIGLDAPYSVLHVSWVDNDAVEFVELKLPRTGAASKASVRNLEKDIVPKLEY